MPSSAPSATAGGSVARDFCRWCGLTPRQYASAGKRRDTGISRQGDTRLSKLLALGASTVMCAARTRSDRATLWQRGILARRPVKVAVLAQAAKIARIARAMVISGATTAGRLRDVHPTLRLRLVAPLEQLIFDLRPARFENARQLFDGDAVDAGRPLVAHHCTQRRVYVVRVTDRLHQMLCGCRAFGFGRRRGRFDLLPVQARGFTRPGICNASSSWYSGRDLVMRCPIYSPFPSTPSRGPFGPSAARSSKGLPAYYALC